MYSPHCVGKVCADTSKADTASISGIASSNAKKRTSAFLMVWQILVMRKVLPPYRSFFLDVAEYIWAAASAVAGADITIPTEADIARSTSMAISTRLISMVY